MSSLDCKIFYFKHTWSDKIFYIDNNLMFGNSFEEHLISISWSLFGKPDQKHDLDLSKIRSRHRDPLDPTCGYHHLNFWLVNHSFHAPLSYCQKLKHPLCGWHVFGHVFVHKLRQSGPKGEQLSGSFWEFEGDISEAKLMNKLSLNFDG